MAEDRKVVIARSRGVSCCSRGWRNWRERSMMEGTTTPESSARCLRGAPACGGALAVRFKLARGGSVADHANDGEIGESEEDVKPAPRLRASNLFLQGREAVWEVDEVGKEHNLEREVHLKAHSMRKVA
eukprot:3253999-Pleurochrysis_carterae.AAC.2